MARGDGRPATIKGWKNAASDLAKSRQRAAAIARGEDPDANKRPKAKRFLKPEDFAGTPETLHHVKKTNEFGTPMETRFIRKSPREGEEHFWTHHTRFDTKKNGAYDVKSTHEYLGTNRAEAAKKHNDFLRSAGYKLRPREEKRESFDLDVRRVISERIAEKLNEARTRRIF